jgi:hypothetical protein
VKKQAAGCKLYLLLAREAPIAVILRRGPSGWYHVIRWHTNTDQFEHGAWFRGRLYEEKCDVSPDGELLLYFALKGSWQTSYRGSWTAISRAPWLHALGLWPQGDTWGGGGRFTGNRTAALWSWSPGDQPHADHPGLGLEIVAGAPNAEDRALFERTGSDWSGRDHAGYGIHASKGRLFRERLGELVEVADFNDLVPSSTPPPDWARAPLAPAPAVKKRRARR